MKSIISTDIQAAADILRQNKLVAIPTETVYGLAGNALNKDAVLKIFETKKRPKFDPLIIHLSDISEVEKYTYSNQVLLDFAEKVWPGPLTILLKKKEIIPDIVSSGLEHVAVRVPNHELTLSLLRILPFPLAAPSANPFGYISPTSAQHVMDQLGSQIPLILDGGSAKVGLESTIIGFENEQLTIYRKGGLTLEYIQENYTHGPVKVLDSSSSDPLAPGMLKKHYSPNKIVRKLGPESILHAEVGVLCFRRFQSQIPEANQFILSKSGNLEEASQRLFEGLRYLDKLEVSEVFLENVPNHGLGLAINDRLKRAAAED
jgi:L-threonylcarbamoyladenylate synthase